MKITLLLFLCIAGFASAQDYSKRYEHDTEPITATAVSSNDALQTVIAGKYGYSDASFVCQLDSSGIIQWQKWIDWQQEGLYNTWINEVVPTTDSCYLISGHGRLLGTPERYQSLLFKMDFDGNMLWIKRFESDDSRCFRPSIEIQNDTTYWLSWGGISGGTLNSIVKLDENGNLMDSFAFEYGDAPNVTSLNMLNDSTLLLAGRLDSSPAKAYMSAISTNGQLQWSYTYDSLRIEDAIIVNNSIYMALYNPHTQGTMFTQGDNVGNILFQTHLGYTYMNFLETKGRIVQMQDSSFVTVFPREEWYPIFIQVDSAGNFISSFEMEGKNGTIMPNTSGGATFISNGPLYGVKNMYDEHFGVVRMDSLLEERDCLYEWFPATQTQQGPIANAFNVALAVAPSEIIGPFNTPVNDATITQSDGCILFLGSVSEFAELIFVQVYPNVSEGIFQFESSLNESIEVVIYSSDGRLIETIENVFEATTVDLSRYSNGSYYYKALSESGYVNSGTLILNR
ncbi:MAG: hypothetical protein Crog4KO_23400 [Crocinitomicaceae bacterium]